MANDVHLLANWRQIAQDLTERIQDGRLRDGERLPSEFVLAEQLGVSRQTVHRALAELKRGGLVDRQRRNGTVVTRGSRRRTGMVALIMDYANDYPQTDLVRGIQSALPSDHALLLFDSGGDAKNEAEGLRRGAATTDGIFIYPTCAPENTLLLGQIVASGTPLVLLDRTPEGADVDAVLSDNYEVTLRAVRGLIRLGHRRIAFFSGDNAHVSSVAERHRAYVDALKEVETYDPLLERWFPKELEHKPDRLAITMGDALHSLLAGPEAPTAVFCVQDLYAAVAFESLSLQGRGGSLEVLTFNDWPPMMLRNASAFHRIVQKPFEIGRVAAERFCARLGEGAEFVSSRLTIHADLTTPSASPVTGARNRKTSPLINGDKKNHES